MEYNTQLITTYQNDMIDETSDTTYRKELLEAFGLEKFDLDEINKGIETLYNSIEKTDHFNEVMKRVSGMFLSEDELLGFTLCFSYHHFHIIHKLVVRYLEDNVIDKELLDAIDH